jgi:AcrR family transcriptional regulator
MGMDDLGRLGREDWLRPARLALLRGGPEAINIEELARELGVTKGSFYWHFKNRQALLEALLLEWEAEKSLLVQSLGKGHLSGGLASFFAELGRRVVMSEQGECPSDAAIFAWASVSPQVARRVHREEQRRIDLLKRMTGQPRQAEFVYMAYLGFLLRGRRLPDPVKRFSLLAELSTALLLSSDPGPRVNDKKSKPKRRR